MGECPYSAAPLGPLTAGGSTPLKVEVILTTSDEVQQLRNQVVDLQEQLFELQRQYDRVEYRYKCEVMLNLQLQDLLMRSGIPFPDRLRTKAE